MKKISIFTLFLAFLFVAQPLFHDGFFNVYDNVHITRLMAFYQELLSGQFPVTYLHSFGHGAGYFLFQFYSPLIYYLGSLFHFIGFSYIQSIKLVYFAFMSFGFVGIYILLKSFSSYFATTLGSLTFILSPYVYHVFFHRGTITEASAMMFIPWIIWLFLRFYRTKKIINLLFASIAISLTILTHTLTAIMAIALVLFLAIIYFDSTLNFLKVIVSIFYAIALSSFFFVPSIYYSRYTQYTNNDLVRRGYLDHPVKIINQLWPFDLNGDRLAVLGATLFLGLILLTLLLFAKQSKLKHKKLAYFVVLSSWISLFIISPASSLIWKSILYLRYVQFPFRFLTITTILTSMAYALVVDYFSNNKFGKLFYTAIIAIFLAFTLNFYKPLGFQYTTNYKVEDPCMTSAWADEHLPIWVKTCFLSQPNSLVTTLNSQTLTIQSVVSRKNGRKFEIDFQGTGELVINKYYFPTWRVINSAGEKLNISPFGENGTIKVFVNQMDSPITLEIFPTNLIYISNIISILSIFLLVCFLIYLNI